MNLFLRPLISHKTTCSVSALNMIKLFSKIRACLFTLSQSSRLATVLYIKCSSLLKQHRTYKIKKSYVIYQKQMFSKENSIINCENTCMNRLQLSITHSLHSECKNKCFSSVIFFVTNKTINSEGNVKV